MFSFSNLTHSYPNSATSVSYTISVTVSDQENASATATTTVQVNRVGPTVTITGGTQGVRYQPLVYTLTVLDDAADLAAGFTFLINWGDKSPIQLMTGGASSGGNLPFTATSTYTVSVVATDSHGQSSSSATEQVQIAAYAFEPDPGNPAKTALVIGGTSGNDTILVNPASHSQISFSINGANTTVAPPTGHILVYGGAGNDLIDVNCGVTNSSLWW